MDGKPQANEHGCWDQVLGIVKGQIDRQSFDTWFRPIVFVSCNDDICNLAVPTALFRKALLENFSDVLHEAVNRVVGSVPRIEISINCEKDDSDADTFPVMRASELGSTAAQKPWLIERLWSEGAVGMVCGPPKALKTWTTLEMAISVASGLPCLKTFPVHHSGPVLLYAAEDPLPALRSRLESLARDHELELEQVDVRVIVADSLRLDRAADRERLTATVDAHRPVLVILDPLVRLHGLDENQAGPMAELLGYLRILQRNTGTAIAIVHHARKNNAPSATAGQNLRGSSDLYAFVDSLVSLHRRQGHIALSAEHRSAPPLAPLSLELVADADQGLALRLGTSPAPLQTRDPMPDRILELLSQEDAPLTTDCIRSRLQVRKQRVIEGLRTLFDSGAISRSDSGYVLQKSSGGIPDRGSVPISTV